VRLRKGLNRVLLKVCQDTGPLGFYLRQDSTVGRPQRVVLPTPLPPLGKGPSAAAQALPTVTSAMRELVARSPSDARPAGRVRPGAGLLPRL
jgi:hypothetical protein